MKGILYCTTSENTNKILKSYIWKNPSLRYLPRSCDNQVLKLRLYHTRSLSDPFCLCQHQALVLPTSSVAVETRKPMCNPPHQLIITWTKFLGPSKYPNLRFLLFRIQKLFALGNLKMKLTPCKD